MITRLMIVMAAVLLFGGFVTNLAPPTDTVQTVAATKGKKDKKQNRKDNKEKQKDRKDNRAKQKDRREKRQERRAVMAFSYINPDTGLGTENPDVEEDSECETPDQRDTQTVSPANSVANNVHNDACLFKKGQPVDTAVSFELSVGSVGVFSGCPDPDMGGTKTATNTGTRCYLTGYQEGSMPTGNEEYHARINSQVPGTSNVTFCADADNNGCADEKTKDRIEILWEAAN